MYKILLAEDDRILRTNLNHFLSGEGFEVLPAENGAAAYELALVNNPELIITDVNMPISDGFHLLKMLKENPITSSIPVIFITSDVELKDKLRDEKDINGYLIKPFNLNDLHDLVMENLVQENNLHSSSSEEE